MVKININVRGVPASAAQSIKVLDSRTILRYLLEKDDKLDTLILCKPEGLQLATTDQNLYEALGSTKQSDNIQINKIVKLLEVVDIYSHKEKSGERKVLKDEQVELLRKQALSEA